MKIHRLVTHDAEEPTAISELVVGRVADLGEDETLRRHDLERARALARLPQRHRILEPETGQHVFELESTGDGSPKVRVAVRVVAQPLRPVDVPRDAERIARTLLDQRHPNQSTTIVRRYREAPDPLVRDAVRGWRTGRFQAVLDGDFDLMA